MENATRFKLSQFSIEELLDELKRRQKSLEESLYDLDQQQWCLKLKQIRIESKLSRKGFAELIGTSPRVLSMAEGGSRPKSAERFVKLIQMKSKKL